MALGLWAGQIGLCCAGLPSYPVTLVAGAGQYLADWGQQLPEKAARWGRHCHRLFFFGGACGGSCHHGACITGQYPAGTGRSLAAYGPAPAW